MPCIPPSPSRPPPEPLPIVRNAPPIPRQSDPTPRRSGLNIHTFAFFEYVRSGTRVDIPTIRSEPLPIRSEPAPIRVHTVLISSTIMLLPLLSPIHHNTICTSRRMSRAWLACNAKPIARAVAMIFAARPRQRPHDRRWRPFRAGGCEGERRRRERWQEGRAREGRGVRARPAAPLAF